MSTERGQDSQRTIMGEEQRESSSNLPGFVLQVQGAWLTSRVIKKGDQLKLCQSICCVLYQCPNERAECSKKSDSSWNLKKLDSHADIYVVGVQCLVVHDYNRHMKVYGYDPKAKSKLAVAYDDCYFLNQPGHWELNKVSNFLVPIQIEKVFNAIHLIFIHLKFKGVTSHFDVGKPTPTLDSSRHQLSRQQSTFDNRGWFIIPNTPARGHSFTNFVTSYV